ncbi:helix-turn-helix domain-containing protein [Streptomyces winkii]|uniref:helix-turn-helix domain-containing protein n=1 Tax=Streptomyces winkii TaxID=3051178 RepID=UPI0028D77D20|nr:helix-turn-helix domain-containing protein [Streptomyces sp. DSM 40971]
MTVSSWQPVTVRMLCGLEGLVGAHLAAGQAGLDQEVRSIEVVSTLASAESVTQGALVIAAPGETELVVLDMMLSAVRAAGAVGFVVTKGPHLVGSATRLAAKLGMPLLVATFKDPLQLARQLDRVVHAPELVRADVLSQLGRQLRRRHTEPGPVLETLARMLSGRASLVSPVGTVLSGSALELPEDALADPAPHTVPGAADGRDGDLVLVPVVLDAQAGPDVWLAVKLPPGPRSWTTTAEEAAAIAASAITGWAARRRLEGERDLRERRDLLSELLKKPGHVKREVAENGLKLGWQVHGWHTGVHLRSMRHTPNRRRTTDVLNAALSEQGLNGHLVERGEGWAFWVTAEREPSHASSKDVVKPLRAALTSLSEEAPVIAGVGRPREGPEGLARTLTEARQACLLACTGARGVRVAHIDELDLQRLLADWYSLESFQTYSRQILKPLSDRGETELIRTVEAYLEHESSASSTAAYLGIHRNTVAERIARVESLLEVNLALPDHRLVMQLACRTLRFGDRRAS